MPAAVAPSAVPAGAAPGRVAALASPGGVPSFLWAARGRPSTRVGARPLPEAAARQHLASYAPYYHLSAAQVGDLSLRDVHDVGRGPVIARFTRRIGGVEVFGEQIAVAMDQNLDPVALSGHISGSAATVAPGRAGLSAAPLDPARAVIAAIADLTSITLDPSELAAAVPASGQYDRVALRAPAALRVGYSSDVQPRVKPVLYPVAADQLVPAYYVEVNLGEGPQREPRAFAHVVGAGGKVLWKKNLTAFESNPYEYSVYADASGLHTPWDGPQGTAASPHPTGIPDGYDAPLLAPGRVTLSSLEEVGVTDPWLPPGATTTLGNNVDAYLDATLPDGFTPGGDFRGRVTAPGSFGQVLIPDQDSTSESQRLAGLTQLFYTVNWLHDWFYAAGFTEAAGNAQFSNYGRGGLEGDALRAESQDFSGWMNANMSTPADGERPTMQMYVFDYGTSALTVTSAQPPAVLATRPVSFAPTQFDVSGRVVRAEPADACESLVGDYSGALVLVDGGFCDPAFQAANAQAAGAAGVIIGNLADDPNPESPHYLFGIPPEPIGIGVLSLGLTGADLLRQALAAGEEVRATLARDSALRDSGLDGMIVAHEWGHYISNRLIGDGSGLDTNMASGLGEGWGDFHAQLMIVREEDSQNPSNAEWNGVYPTGGYAEAGFGDIYYFGIRRYPYSTDMAKNPLTFIHISEEGVLPPEVPTSGDYQHTEPHAIGEVWANMLWECNAALLRDTLGPSPRLSFAEARDRMRDYLVAAYKLTPNSPTLLEARDALLAAALVSDPIDHARFAAAFAKRGAGVFAEAPDRFDPDNLGVVESYADGAAVVAGAAVLADDVAPRCAADGSLDTGEAGHLRLTFENVGSAASAALEAVVSTDSPGLSFP
ncbi:MAG TPA: M36 family metallopeptidase, partial [Polyangiaceae bacterium]|nr:M36 family metallopeptidase [Polyangiaceae bacterium]